MSMNNFVLPYGLEVESAEPDKNMIIIKFAS